MIEDKKIKDIFDKFITHKSFLDKESVLTCMNESFLLGKEKTLSDFKEIDNLFKNFIDQCKKESKNEFCPKLLSLDKKLKLS